MNKRTAIDFSKHEVKIIQSQHVLIHEFKIPNTIKHSLTFINSCGVMTVTGDFGNWVFCREFHPSANAEFQNLANTEAKKATEKFEARMQELKSENKVERVAPKWN